MDVTLLEDLRGRQFSWHRAESNPHETILFEDPVEVGRLVRVPDLRPTFFTEFAGLRLRIEYGATVLGPTFEVSDADKRELLIRSHYTREADLRAILGDRAYSLHHSGNLAIWNDSVEDAVSLRSHEGFVLMGADPRDAGPLLLLGIVMATENALFPESIRRA